jgi:hypothetical protein
MKMTPAFRAYCRRVARAAEAAVTAKRKTRKGLDAIRTLGALALALTVLTPAAMAQHPPATPRTGFEIQATFTVALPPFWSKKTFKTQEACDTRLGSDDQKQWGEEARERLETQFGEGTVTVVQVCQPAVERSDDDDK